MPTEEGIGIKRYIASRIIQTLIVWFLTISLNFFIFRIMPGDPRASLINENMPPELIQAVVARFGLDQPLLTQYFIYLRNVFIGEWGQSFSDFGQSVSVVIFGRPNIVYIFGVPVAVGFRHPSPLVNTIWLMGTSMFIAIIIGIIFGVLAAWKRNSILDVSSTVGFLVTYSFPVFWLGLLILYYLGFVFNMIPLAGTVTPGVTHPTYFHFLRDYLWHMTGPTIVLTVSFIGMFFLIMRDSVLDVFTQDYMLAARAKGLGTRKVLFNHAMRNALLPMVSVIAVSMPYLISGASITEFIFTWNGLGTKILNAVITNDWPVLQAIFLLLATVAIISNFIADLIYLYLDPRIRY